MATQHYGIIIRFAKFKARIGKNVIAHPLVGKEWGVRRLPLPPSCAKVGKKVVSPFWMKIGKGVIFLLAAYGRVPPRQLAL